MNAQKILEKMDRETTCCWASDLTPTENRVVKRACNRLKRELLKEIHNIHDIMAVLKFFEYGRVKR